MNLKKCTIFGVGFLGRYLIRSLSKKNYKCIIPTRNVFQKGYLKTQATNPGDIELIEFNTGNFATIKKAIERSDFVVNLIGILNQSRKNKFNKIHSDLPDMISNLCANSDVKKLIHISAIGANESSKSIYQKTKYLGEQNVLKNFKNTVILRPSVVVGQEDQFTNLFAKLSFFPVIPVPNKNYRFQPVYVQDVADAIVRAIEQKNNEGKIYEIGGPKIFTFEDMINTIMKIIGKKRFVIQMPMQLAKIQSTIFEMLPFPPILTRDQCQILSEGDNVVSEKNLKLSDLNITPTDIEKVMENWLWRYRSSGQFWRKKK